MNSPRIHHSPCLNKGYYLLLFVKGCFMELPIMQELQLISVSKRRYKGDSLYRVNKEWT